MELSAMDRRIVAELDLDGSCTPASLVRRLGFSRDRIATRLAALDESGVIAGYTTVVDIGLLGFTGVAVYLRFGGRGEEQRMKVMNTLRANERIYWLAELWGGYDAVFAVQAVNMNDFATIMANIQKRSPEILDSKIAIRTNVRQYQRTYLTGQRAKRKQFSFSSSGSQVTLASTDRTVLKAIIAEPRTTISDLSDNLELSRPTLYASIKRLEQSGVLRGSAALFNSGAAGFGCYHLLLHLRRTDPATRLAIQIYCYSKPNITFCIDSVGAWQCEIACETASHQELQRIVVELRRLLKETVAEIEVASFTRYYSKYRFYLA